MNDPLSDVLTVLEPRSVRGTSLEAGGSWALSFDGRQRLKFVAVLTGRCWLVLPDRDPEALVEGDVILLSNISYTVASQPDIEPSDGMALYAPPGHNTVRLGDYCDTMLIGGGSGFASVNASFLLDALPAFLRVDPGSSWARSIARTLSALKEEADAGQIGGDLVAGKLAEILIIEAVRSYSSSAPVANVGWITALGDARLAKAIRLMHDDVARRWTIDALAREIGMSRSALTLRFSQRVGRAPMDYLTRWRMVLAAALGEWGQRLGSSTCRRLQLAKRLRPRLQARHRTYAERGIMAMALHTGWKHHMIDAINRWRFGLFVC